LALPYLLKSKNPHILNLSPPLSLNPKWFRNNVAYTMAKYGMSFCVLGMSEEFKDEGVAVNALWPRTAIATDAIDFIGSTEMRKQSRTVDIMADAAYEILIKDSRSFTGKFVIDEYLLRDELGIKNFDKYAVDLSSELMLDFFVDEEANLNSPTLVGQVAAAAPAAPAVATPTPAAGTTYFLISFLSQFYSDNVDEILFYRLLLKRGICEMKHDNEIA
jgi:hypothetical protein